MLWRWLFAGCGRAKSNPCHTRDQRIDDVICRRRQMQWVDFSVPQYSRRQRRRVLTDQGDLVARIGR